MSGIRTPEDLKARCWVDEDTGCWHWRGAVDSNNSPSFWFPPLRRRASLGVAACYFTIGEGPERGQAWHCKCETRGCANPEHRRCGTRKTQMLALNLTRTPLERARISVGKLANSHLTTEQRLEIANSTETLNTLAERYGVSRSLCSNLKRGKQYQRETGFGVFSWRP